MRSVVGNFKWSSPCFFAGIERQCSQSSCKLNSHSKPCGLTKSIRTPHLLLRQWPAHRVPTIWFGTGIQLINWDIEQIDLKKPRIFVSTRISYFFPFSPISSGPVAISYYLNLWIDFFYVHSWKFINSLLQHPVLSILARFWNGKALNVLLVRVFLGWQLRSCLNFGSFIQVKYAHAWTHNKCEIYMFSVLSHTFIVLLTFPFNLLLCGTCSCRCSLTAQPVACSGVQCRVVLSFHIVAIGGTYLEDWS